MEGFLIMKLNERDFLFDNIKGFLIVLVVFGHVIENYAYYNNKSIISLLYQLIYIFHMPLFVFVSGYFSKKDNPRKIAELLILYTLFQIIFFPLSAAFFKEQTYLENVQSFFKPEFTYWYMLSLIGWRALNPTLIKIKFIFPLSILAGVLVGLTPGNDSLTFLSVGRSVSFYPFFLLGYLTKAEDIKNIRRKLPFKKAIIILILSTVISIIFLDFLSNFLVNDNEIFKILFAKEVYSKYLIKPTNGIILKLVLYFIQILFICSLLTLFTSKKTLLFKLSINSLFIYLTHGVFVDCFKFKYYDKFDISNKNTLVILAISFIISLLYCILLSHTPLSKIGEYINKIPSLLLVKDKKE